MSEKNPNSDHFYSKIDPNMKDHSNDPYFVKKNEESEAF